MLNRRWGRNEAQWPARIAIVKSPFSPGVRNGARAQAIPR